MSPRGWIGVDLDGTLAEYDGWKGTEHIGDPIPAMVARVQAWLADGTEVRIVTARCHHSQPEATAAVEEWCERHLGARLKVTCEKDFGMIELWDDRAVQVETNTGRRIDETPPPPVSPEAAPGASQSFERRAADALAAAVLALVERGVVGARSEAGDALLDYAQVRHGEVDELSAAIERAAVFSPEAAPPRAKPRDVCWLIERGQAERQSPTVWWTGTEWSPVAMLAQRFPTRDAADAEITARSGYVGDRFGRAVEHVFAIYVWANDLNDRTRAAPPRATTPEPMTPESLMLKHSYTSWSELLADAELGASVRAGSPSRDAARMREAIPQIENAVAYLTESQDHGRARACCWRALELLRLAPTGEPTTRPETRE